MSRGSGRLLRMVLLGLCLLGFSVAAAGPLLAAAPPAAEESQPAEETASNHELIFDIVNFILLVGVLGYLYRKHGRNFYNERADGIRASLEEGRRALEESRAKLAEAERKLGHFEEEVAALKKRAEEEIAQERERMRLAADEEARKIQDLARVQIQAATNTAKLELKTYVVEQALDQASGLIRERLDAKNRRKMVSFFLADLKSKINKN